MDREIITTVSDLVFDLVLYWTFEQISINIFLQLKKGRVTKFNATFNNFSVISWQSVLLVEKTEVLGENHDLSHITEKL